jgi:hypothetical protein
MGSVDHPEDWIELSRVARGVRLVRRFGPLPETFVLGGDAGGASLIVDTSPPLPDAALRFRRTRSGGYDVTDLCEPALHTGLLPAEPGRGRPRLDGPEHPLRAGTKWMPGDGLVLRFGADRLVLVLRREAAIEDPGAESPPPPDEPEASGHARAAVPSVPAQRGPTPRPGATAQPAPTPEPSRQAAATLGVAGETRRRLDAWARHRLPGYAAARDSLRLLAQGAGLGPWGIGGLVFAAIAALIGGFLLAMGW